MTPEVALRLHLLAAPPVTALAGDRVYLGRLPNGSTYPAITLHRISRPRRRDLDGVAYYQVRVQCSCWSNVYQHPMLLADAIEKAVEGYSGPMGDLRVILAEVINDTEQPDDTGLYHVPVDVMIRYANRRND